MRTRTGTPIGHRVGGVIALQAIGCALALTATAALWAAGTTTEGIAEVVVTATKQGATSIQDTPIAVQALTGAELASIGAVQISDYVALVPGLTYQDNGPGDKRYAIRGVSSTGAGTVGVYLDEVVITGENSQDGGGQQPDIMLFDMDRVEVLKGPQGTTFGSSSMTGTIRFITAKPSLTEFTGSMSAGALDTSGGGTGSQLNAMVNLPLVQDKFAIRLAGFYLDDPGYVSNQFEHNANETRVKAGRVEAKLAITDDVTLSGMSMVQQTAADAIGYYNTLTADGLPISQAPGYRPGQFFQDNQAREPVGNRMSMDNLNLDYRASYGTYTFTASQFQRDLNYTRDASYVLQAFFGLPAVTTGRSVIDYPKERTLHTYEARFASSWAGPVQLLFGLFDQTEDRNFRSHVLFADPQGYVPAGAGVFLNRTEFDKITEKAIFTELTWSITNQWKLTAGARGYDNGADESSDGIISFGGGAGSGPVALQSSKDTGVIGKVNLSYKPIEHVLAYAEVSQGFRSGGVNDQTAAEFAHVTIPAGFGSDSLVNYELGLKTSWLDDKVVANGAVYYIDWSKIQVQDEAVGGGGTFPYTGNAGAATIKGLELEIQAAPIAGLRLGAYANFNQAELSENSPIASDGMKGDLIPYVPKTTFTVTSDYDWALSVKDLKATVGAQYAYVSSRNSELVSSDPAFEVFPSYETTTLRTGVKAATWSAIFNVANVFNNTTTIADSSVSYPQTPRSPIPNRPRTYSLIFTTSF